MQGATAVGSGRVPSAQSGEQLVVHPPSPIPDPPLTLGLPDQHVGLPCLGHALQLWAAVLTLHTFEVLGT